MSKLRKAAKDQACVRCHVRNGTVVLAHYFGPRRHSYGGGMSRKGHDAIGAWLCADCHRFMDQEARELRGKESRWLNSEEFLHYVALTVIQLFEQEIVKL